MNYRRNEIPLPSLPRRTSTLRWLRRGPGYLVKRFGVKNFILEFLYALLFIGGHLLCGMGLLYLGPSAVVAIFTFLIWNIAGGIEKNERQRTTRGM